MECLVDGWHDGLYNSLKCAADASVTSSARIHQSQCQINHTGYNQTCLILTYTLRPEIRTHFKPQFPALSLNRSITLCRLLSCQLLRDSSKHKYSTVYLTSLVEISKSCCQDWSVLRLITTIDVELLISKAGGTIVDGMDSFIFQG